jgi:hypothetical protein
MRSWASSPTGAPDRAAGRVLVWNGAAAQVLGEPSRAPDGVRKLLWWMLTEPRPHGLGWSATARRTRAQSRASRGPPRIPPAGVPHRIDDRTARAADEGLGSGREPSHCWNLHCDIAVDPTAAPEIEKQ